MDHFRRDAYSVRLTSGKRNSRTIFDIEAVGTMTSDTHDVLPGGKAEWERAERAVDRLIAAHHNLMRDGGDTADQPGSVHAAAPDAAAAIPAAAALEPAAAAPEPAAQPSRLHWPTVILLSVVWISVALVVSAAILSVAMLL
jgi:hypothetical protein